MSVYELVFVFGKSGSYMLDHPKRCTKRNLPKSLLGDMEDYPVQNVQSLALDANGNYFFRWIDSSGRSWTNSRGLEAEYELLYDYLDENDAHQTSVTFGPTIGDFFLWNDEDSSWKWQGDLNIPFSLEDDKRHIKQVSLGLDESYFILFTNGEWDAECSPAYPDLHELLISHERGDVVFVAMNPHRRNEFFIALADGKVHIRASAVCEADVVEVLSDYDQLEIITSHVSNFSHDLTEEPALPQRLRKGEFLKGIAKSAAGGLVTSIVTAVVTASCTVM